MALPHISYSRLHMLACPYASFLRYAGNVKGPTTPWIARGNAVHHALENAFTEQGFNLAHAIELYKAESMRIIEEENVSVDWAKLKKMEAEAIIMLEKFYERIESGQIPSHPLALEKEFKLPFLDTYVVGKIDKVDLDEDGEYTVTDYKTGKAKPDKWFLRHNLQLTAYAWACLELYGKLPKKLIWHHLATDEILETERSLADIDDLKAMIANAIKMDEEGIKHRIYHEDICAKCDYVGALCDDRDLEAEIEHSLETGIRMPKSIYVKPQKWNLA